MTLIIEAGGWLTGFGAGVGGGGRAAFCPCATCICAHACTCMRDPMPDACMCAHAHHPCACMHLCASGVRPCTGWVCVLHASVHMGVCVRANG